MNLQITLDVSGGPTGAAKQLRSLANMLDPQDVVVGPSPTAKPITGKTKPPAKPVEEEEEFNLGETEEEAPVKVTIKDVVTGFQAYAKANGRDEAAKILKKFKVKNVHDLKPEQYAKALEDVAV